jgi:flagellar hook-associated protein 3 FlgL
MADLRASIQKTQTQIATGQLIERGSDDPAVAAQLRTIARRDALNAVEGDNAAQLDQDLTAASDELEAVTSLLQRARELAVQAANTPTGDNGRQVIALELSQLSEELFTRANGTALTGEPLFADIISRSTSLKAVVDGWAAAKAPNGSRLPSTMAKTAARKASDFDVDQ